MSHKNPDNARPILVTGGAGFIGSNFILAWMEEIGTSVINIDKLTYAANLENLACQASSPKYTFVQGDICDAVLLDRVFHQHRPLAVVHFAAETHVDRSIRDPAIFVTTNVNGTFTLLESARAFWMTLPAHEKAEFRFLHVSSDEVYGSLSADDPAFTEQTPYSPNSPYSASKAASDHLVRAYHHTYGLPVLTTHCSNNYGPLQFPEKLIPLVIHNAFDGRALPVYGDGKNVRDWLYVRDHCEALRIVLERGRVGETYNIGGNCELSNLDLVASICAVMDELDPVRAPHERLLSFVLDRPGHDRRYAVDISKINSELGWTPKESFQSGIQKTIQWYRDNADWVARATTSMNASAFSAPVSARCSCD
jgi:dTDP-glucose 4,6-dehydratase